ncbi:MAG: pimeloyl-ACP methyl ester carboxylesterase [Bradymonadia bacterium]|jgi:pimeloyl-ACP methyl ester carboxylesterase
MRYSSILILVSAALVGCDDGASGVADPLSDASAVDASALDSGAPDMAAFDPSPQTTTLTVGALRFDALVAGPQDGPGVILLHGFPQTNHAWAAYLQPLADAGFRVVAPNQRGYSATARPGEVDQYALPLLAADVLGVADAMGFDRFHLVGHDWGAAVTWYVAATSPGRILTANPLSVPHLTAFANALADPESDQAERSSYFALFRSPTAQDLMLANDAAILRTQVWADLPATAIEAYLAVLGTPEALGAALNWYRANDFAAAPAIPAVTVPTMYIWGDADTALGPDSANATGDFVEGPYRFEIVAGGTHWLPELNAEQVLPLLLDHLAQ